MTKETVSKDTTTRNDPTRLTQSRQNNRQQGPNSINPRSLAYAIEMAQGDLSTTTTSSSSMEVNNPHVPPATAETIANNAISDSNTSYCNLMTTLGTDASAVDRDIEALLAQESHEKISLQEECNQLRKTIQEKDIEIQKLKAQLSLHHELMQSMMEEAQNVSSEVRSLSGGIIALTDNMQSATETVRQFNNSCSSSR